MRALAVSRLLTRQDLDHFLEKTISWLRWATIAALLVISLAQPSAGGTNLPDWALLILFAGYNLLVELIRRRFSRLSAFAWFAVLDLPVIALIYLNCSQPGGPLFALLILAAVQTTVFMTLTGNLLYTSALAAITIAVERTSPLWTGTLTEERSLAARLVILAMVGVGIGALTRRLEAERVAGKEMLDQTGRLAELDRLRADFVSTVSHELRTPLTAARAGLILLDASAGGGLRAEQRDLLTNARRNVERLGLLINDLLTHNQLEAGILPLDHEPVDLRTVIADAMAAIQPLVIERGQTLDLDLPVPLPIEGDAVRLEQAVLNVLANATRHTPPGTRIVVAGRVEGDDVLVSVRDDGPGIPPNALEAIFRRFYRITTEEGGSGLGLAIARRIVELHGGRMWAESEPGQGATFWISVPCHRTGGERRP